MCEWLSCREWCDVRLVCGSRSFSAHRAVLASASSFLKQLLLSCPEDLPAFIVLPDFDLEVVSSMLYYIYNGEVTIQKTKMKMFLDIIKDMQIFVDGQYLQDIGKSNIEIADKLHSEHFQSSKNLGFENDINQGIVHIKKYGQSDVTPPSAYKVRENHTLHRDTAKTSTSANKTPSTHADRQRNSFLRDLCTETYPRNRNVNSCAGGVLEILNEYYLASKSVLLKNANGKQLGDETLPASFEMGLTTPTSADCHPWKWKKYNESKRCTKLQNNNFDFSNFTDTYQDLAKPGCDNSLLNLFPEPSENDLVKFNSQNIICNNLKSKKEMKDKYDEKVVRDCRNELVLKERHITRGTVLNKVMESPWCSRVPNNFKPFRRKNYEKEYHNLNTENRNFVKQETNDSNNNAQTTKPMDTFSNTINDIQSLILRTDTDETQNKCFICNEIFPSSDLLTSHKKLHSGRFSCDQCSKTFSQLRNFKYHMSVHRGTREFAATCPVCGKYFNDRGYLSSHMKIHRNRKEYKCSQCPKSFNQRVAYNMHVRIHTGVKPHVCEQCGKAFSRKMLLKQHLRTHSGERPYACAHCDKRFADRSNMTLHLRLHTGVKPFSCSICCKAFTKKHHLKSHLNFHTGAKPYSCPRCKLAFTQSSNMRTHFKKCSVESQEEISSVSG